MELEKLRGQIDEIDRQIVGLFENRMEIVSKVSKYKLEKHLPIFDSSREDEVIEKNIKHLKNKELSPYIRSFYINLMKTSKEYQKTNIENLKRK